MSQPASSLVSYEEYKCLYEQYLASQKPVALGNQRIKELENKVVEIEDSSGWMKTVCMQLSLLRNTFEETMANVAAKQLQSLESLKDAFFGIIKTQHRQQQALDQLPAQLARLKENTVSIDDISLDAVVDRVAEVSSQMDSLEASTKTTASQTSKLLELTQKQTIEATSSAAYSNSILRATEDIAIMLKGPDYAESDLGLKTLFNEDPDLQTDQPICTRILKLEETIDSAVGFIAKMYGKVILEALKSQKASLELTGLVMDLELKKQKSVVEPAAGVWKKSFGVVLVSFYFLSRMVYSFLVFLLIISAFSLAGHLTSVQENESSLCFNIG